MFRSPLIEHESTEIIFHSVLLVKQNIRSEITFTSRVCAIIAAVVAQSDWNFSQV